MILTTLSTKHQTSVSAEVVRALKLKPGTKFRHWSENGRIIYEPVKDIMSTYGIFASGQPALSREEEKARMERAIAESVMKSQGDE